MPRGTSKETKLPLQYEWSINATLMEEFDEEHQR